MFHDIYYVRFVEIKHPHFFLNVSKDSLGPKRQCGMLPFGNPARTTWRRLRNMCTCLANPRHRTRHCLLAVVFQFRRRRVKERCRAKLVLSLTSPANSRRNSVSFPMPSRRSVCLPPEDTLPPFSELPNCRCHPTGAQLCGGNGHRSHGESSGKVSRVSGQRRERGSEVVMGPHEK